jgi:hypothetical protein
MDKATQCMREHDQMVGERSPHETVWNECFLWTDPVLGTGLAGPTMTSATEIAKAVAEIFDSTGMDAKRVLDASIMAGMTPANAQWLQIEVSGADEDGDQWLDIASRDLWNYIHQSNYNAEGADTFSTMTGGGWAVLFIDEDRENGGFLFEQWPMGQCWVRSSKAGGPIDIVHRCYKLSAEQIVNKFKLPGDQIPSTILDASKTDPTKKFDLLHVIEPRAKYAVNARLAKNMPVASYHILIDGKKMIRESGFQEMPCVVPRWKKIPDSFYAVGPVLDALPDVRTLNCIVKLEYANLDLAVSGMWIAEDDGVLNPRTVRVGPRKIIVASTVDAMKALAPATSFQLADNRIQTLQGQVRRILMAEQLGPIGSPVMTATEVIQRMNLIRQLLGPTYGRLQDEFLQPMVTRCFGIAYRAGALGQAPDSIAGRPFSVKYKNPLARAQQMDDVQAIERWVGDLEVMGQVDQSVIDVADLDEAARVAGQGLGVPAQLIRTPDQVTEFRQRKQAQAMQQQQAQAAMQAQADVSKQVGGAIADRMTAQQ